QHRRIKHRMTVYMIKDTDLMYPMTALHWYTPFISVIVDKASADAARVTQLKCPSCLGASPGVNAPNNRPNNIFTDPGGQRLTGHWVIPPGEHTYRTVLANFQNPGFDNRDRLIHAVWSHVHPLCTKIALYKCSGGSRSCVFSASSRTKTQPGLEI